MAVGNLDTASTRSAWRRLGALGTFGRLPERAQRIVDGETREAEMLSAWLVVAIAVFFNVLYAVSPKALDAMGAFRPVPVVGGIFLVLGLVRVALARRGRMRGWLVPAFTVVDFGLLYGLIWSFHLQYQQPAAFYLKAPTFLLVFLFIAIRALRFEPRLVIFAGCVAAAGWVGMTAYALHAGDADGDGPVTRDFVTYMTSSSILVGAEVEKIVAILLFTGVLAIVIARGRRQLLTAALGLSATAELSRFFDPTIARRITSGDALAPGRGEMVEAAVLMADIRGFTRFVADHPPAEVMRLLVAYQQRMGAVIAEHGGAIDKFLGDGILATFGCTGASQTPAADALRAALALTGEAAVFGRAFAAASGRKVEIGFAAVFGRVLFGTVGNDGRLEYTVIGEPVNLAAKLEKHNKVGCTCVVTDAATLVKAEAEGFAATSAFRLVPGVTVEGVAGPVDLAVIDQEKVAEPA